MLEDGPVLTPSFQELNLPKSIITRLAKGVLPPNIQIQSNAVIALRQSATVFINYLASQYVSLCLSSQSPLSTHLL